MRTIKVKKLWRGMISIRDYEVEKGIKEGGLLIKFNSETMYLSKEELKNGSPNHLKLSSKWGNQSYDLIDFVWNPTAGRQLKLL